MAVINCPHCNGKLRFPDDAEPRKVKCPSCSQSFMAGPKGPITEDGAPKKEQASARKKADEDVADDDFEVVDDKPRSKKRDDDDDDNRPRKKSRKDDEDEDDEPRSKRRRDEDDEDDDKPRSKRRKDEDDDDEDDRPRSKRRSRDDDDEDDDRPRSKRRGRDDEDDDEDDDRPRKKESSKSEVRNSRQGVGLAGIGLWCQVGALGVAFFLDFLWLICGVYETAHDLRLLAGLPGMVNWIIAMVGFSFLIAGVKKGNLLGLTIALVAVAAIHLVLVVYLSFDKGSSAGYGKLGKSGSISWEAMPTQLPAMMGMLLQGSFETWPFLSALLELSRFVLFMLVVKELGTVCKSKDVSNGAMGQVIMMPILVGILLVVFLLMRLILKEMSSGGRYIYFFVVLLEYGGFIALYVMSALLCSQAKDSISMPKGKAKTKRKPLVE